MTPRLRTALLATLAGLLAAPAAAQASAAQLAVFQDDGVLRHSGDGVRERRLDELQRLGVDVVKTHVRWHEIAPGGERRPEGFRGWLLSEYREGAFASLDAFVRDVKARGMRVMLAPVGPAPCWATAGNCDGDQGVWRPSQREFGRFVRALGTRYDGRHADSSGKPLPRVRFWAIWNEPNHPDFLKPQGSSRRRRFIAPHEYRGLVEWAVSGLRLSGHRNDSILFGEILPIGHSRIGVRNTIKPIHFMRELFCLDRRWRPYRGRAARVRGCDDYEELNDVTGFGYHPYTRPVGPHRTREPSRYDATIGALGRIERALDRAAARDRVRRGLGIYNTEFGFQSDPPDPFQASLRRIPKFLNESEWITYRNRRVKTFSQYTLIDDPVRRDGDGEPDYGGFQSGLYFAEGDRKDRVYNSFRLPFFVTLEGRRTVEIWGGVRLRESRGTTVQVQQRRRGRDYRDLGEPIAIRNYRGYFRERFRIRDPDERRYRFVYRSRDGETLVSRSTRAARR